MPPDDMQPTVRVQMQPKSVANRHQATETERNQFNSVESNRFRCATTSIQQNLRTLHEIESSKSLRDELRRAFRLQIPAKMSKCTISQTVVTRLQRNWNHSFSSIRTTSFTLYVMISLSCFLVPMRHWIGVSLPSEISECSSMDTCNQSYENYVFVCYLIQ